MAKKRSKAEEIIQILREIEVLTSQGKTVAEAAKQRALSSKPTSGGVVNMGGWTKAKCGGSRSWNRKMRD